MEDITREEAMRDIVEANRFVGRTDDQIRERLGSLLRPEDEEGRALLGQLLSDGASTSIRGAE